MRGVRVTKEGAGSPEQCLTRADGADAQFDHEHAEVLHSGRVVSGPTPPVRGVEAWLFYGLRGAHGGLTLATRGARWPTPGGQPTTFPRCGAVFFCLLFVRARKPGSSPAGILLHPGRAARATARPGFLISVFHS